MGVDSKKVSDLSRLLDVIEIEERDFMIQLKTLYGRNQRLTSEIKGLQAEEVKLFERWERDILHNINAAYSSQFYLCAISDHKLHVTRLEQEFACLTVAISKCRGKLSTTSTKKEYLTKTIKDMMKSITRKKEEKNMNRSVDNFIHNNNERFAHDG